MVHVSPNNQKRPREEKLETIKELNTMSVRYSVYRKEKNRKVKRGLSEASSSTRPSAPPEQDGVPHRYPS